MSTVTDPADLLDGVFEASPMPILVHDFESLEVVRANDAAATLLELPRAEMRGRSIAELLPDMAPAELEKLLAIVEQAKSQGTASAEWNPIDDDDERRNVALQMEVLETDGRQYLLSFVQEVTEVREQAAELREQQLLREAVFNSPEMFIGLLDADGNLLEANQTALDFASVDPAEVEGTPFYETVWWADDRVDTAERLESAIAAANDGQSARFTTEHYSADDERIAASVVVRPVFDEGEVSYIIVEGTDITDQRARERELRERSEELETLVNNLPVVLFTTDEDGVFTRSVGKGLEALDLEPGEFVGLSAYDVYGDRDDIVAGLDRALAGEEVRLTHDLQDRTFETWYRPVVGADGAVEELIGVARDVTANKRREERIEAIGEASRNLLFTESPEEVADVVLGISQRIIGEDLAAMRRYDEETDTLRPISATAGAEEMLEGDGVSDLPVVSAEDEEMAMFRAGESTVVRDVGTRGDLVLPQPWFESLFFVPLGEYGLLTIGSSSTEGFSDVEKHLIEILAGNATAALQNAERDQELAAYRDELERSNESLQQFAYVASHDLQEPLRMVSSYVDLLETEYGDELDGEAREYMDFAVDGATRMKQMIDGLLDYSRVHTKAADPEPIDPNPVLDGVVDSLKRLVEDTGGTIERDSLPPVEADSNQVGQLFQNLISNALKHGGNAPTVSVTATVTDDDMVRFAVSDDGPGIPPAQQDRIFEIFEQGSRDQDGTGIGLALSERIVHRHGGDIWVDSESDGGATFYFTLPSSAETTTETTL
ncbi:PAS domain-containing protein [Halobacteriales archaeon Cl-PHB]